MPLSFVSFFIEIALFVKSLEKILNNSLSMKQIMDSHTGNFGNIVITKYWDSTGKIVHTEVIWKAPNEDGDVNIFWKFLVKLQAACLSYLNQVTGL